ncbi:MAG: M20 metallopeptidase family protein [Bacillota bacterium]
MNTEQIRKVIDRIESEVIEIRHKIHQNPELAFEETDTARLVANKLKDLDLKVETNVFKTGVMGILEKDKAKKTILLRADMDALPIQEDTGLKFSSQNKGVMHACGHDAHVAILLGTAMVLNELKSELVGNVKFIFQPAEESEGGAKGMIEEGVLKNPDVDAALGLHVWGSVPKGVVEYKVGTFMASPDKFVVRLFGQGGHAAQPHNCVDLISLSTQIINGFQRIVSRQIDPVESAVISTCHIEAGETHNVIPKELLLEGTVRSLKPKNRKKLPKLMEKVIKNTMSVEGADYQFNYEYRFPPLINDKDMTNLVKQAANKILGSTRLRQAAKPNMGGEDFAYFAREVPSCFFFLGIAPSDDQTIQHHRPEFKVDDDVLKDGIAVLSQAVIDFFTQTD